MINNIYTSPQTHLIRMTITGQSIHIRKTHLSMLLSFTTHFSYTLPGLLRPYVQSRLPGQYHSACVLQRHHMLSRPKLPWSFLLGDQTDVGLCGEIAIWCTSVLIRSGSLRLFKPWTVILALPRQSRISVCPTRYIESWYVDNCHYPYHRENKKSVMTLFAYMIQAVRIRQGDESSRDHERRRRKGKKRKRKKNNQMRTYTNSL